MSLEEIFDTPVDESFPAASSRTRSASTKDDDDEPARPSKRSRPSLFLAGSDDEEESFALPNSRRDAAPRTPGRDVPDVDIDEMFADLDEASLSLAAPLDMNALQREAREQRERELALTPHAILPSSSPPRVTGDTSNKDKGKDANGEKKERKKIARLDEARLLGSDGFPALIRQTKHWKPKGKGHEHSDLNSLLQIYQFWAHKMYPKTHFRDTVKTVEKLCHSKRMHVALSVWKDEAKGLVNGQKPEQINLDSDDDESGGDSGQRVLPQASSSRGSSPGQPPPSSPSEAVSRRASSSGSTGVLVEDDDFDVDAMIAEEEARRADMEKAPLTSAKPPAANIASTSANTEDFDEEMWDELMNDFGADVPAKPAAPASHTTQRQAATSVPDDEDMWDIVHEIEAENAAKKSAENAGTTAGNTQHSKENGTQYHNNSTGLSSMFDDDDDDLYMDP